MRFLLCMHTCIVLLPTTGSSIWLVWLICDPFLEGHLGLQSHSKSKKKLVDSNTRLANSNAELNAKVKALQEQLALRQETSLEKQKDNLA